MTTSSCLHSSKCTSNYIIYTLKNFENIASKFVNTAVNFIPHLHTCSWLACQKRSYFITTSISVLLFHAITSQFASALVWPFILSFSQQQWKMYRQCTALSLIFLYHLNIKTHQNTVYFYCMSQYSLPQNAMIILYKNT